MYHNHHDMGLLNTLLTCCGLHSEYASVNFGMCLPLVRCGLAYTPNFGVYHDFMCTIILVCTVVLVCEILLVCTIVLVCEFFGVYHQYDVSLRMVLSTRGGIRIEF